GIQPAARLCRAAFFAHAEGIEGGPEVVRNRRLGRAGLAGPRMREAESTRVEHLPRRGGRTGARIAVDAVSEDGMARGREVDPDLMRPSGLGSDRDEGRSGEALERLVASHRPLALLPGACDRSPQAGLPDEVG